MAAKFRLISNHQEDLDDGRVLDPGEYVYLSDEEVRLPRATTLLADGKLIGTGEKSEHESELAAKRDSRRAKKVEEEGGNP